MMKKCFVVVMAVFMVFMIGEAALAADCSGSLYLDTMIDGGGTWLIKGTDEESGAMTTVTDMDISSNPWTFGGDYAFGAFVIGADYISGRSEISRGNHDMCDYTIYDLGLGYRIINKDSFKLDLKALYYHLSDTDQTGVIDSEDIASAYFNYSMNGYMLDLKASVNFSDQFSLTASYGASLSGDVSNHYLKSGIKKSGTLSTADLKLIYMFSSNFGASLGYRLLNYEPKYSADGIIMKFPNKIDGFTVGIYFKY